MEFTADNKKKFDTLLTRYPTKKAAILPTLWLVQGQYGFISDEAMEYVGKLLDLSPVHVLSVVTFYTMFNRKPVGKHHIQVCRTLSCAMMGADSLVDHLKTKLKINEGETTRDGKFSLCTVECLASCGTAPAIMINEAYHENLTPAKLDKILAELA
ncbi:NADH-quinone oxidoreductase subunit NuoE [bacterium]|nr:NADH-quinone oxidoreductase subunit NuoE [bacterium]